jgi:hypothetical protein
VNAVPTQATATPVDAGTFQDRSVEIERRRAALLQRAHEVTTAMDRQIREMIERHLAPSHPPAMGG